MSTKDTTEGGGGAAYRAGKKGFDVFVERQDPPQTALLDEWQDRLRNMAKSGGGGQGQRFQAGENNKKMAAKETTPLKIPPPHFLSTKVLAGRPALEETL